MTENKGKTRSRKKSHRGNRGAKAQTPREKRGGGGNAPAFLLPEKKLPRRAGHGSEKLAGQKTQREGKEGDVEKGTSRP